MPTIGLDKVYYAKITEDTNGNESYGIPIHLARATEAEISLETYDAEHYSDDSAAFIINDFKKATITLGIDEITKLAAVDLFGTIKDDNGVLISAGEDKSNPVALGFRSKRADGNYEYNWLYRVVFKNPGTSYKTKGDSIEFTTPSLEGTITVRNKVDSNGTHVWRAKAIENDEETSASIINNWFNAVYEGGKDVTLSALTIGNLPLKPSFSSNTISYELTTSDESNVITVAPSDPLATVIIKVNGTTHTSGTATTWNSGENTVSIVVTNGTSSKSYTLKVTKE